MENSALTKAKYPIGEFQFPISISKTELKNYINDIETFPEKLRSATKKLTNEQLDTPYRDGGWTIKQVVHHLADSHMNAYIRTKLAYTEENPEIKTYFEDKWAETVDGKKMPIEISLQLITALHTRWSKFLESLTENEFEKTLFHPEHRKKMKINEVIALYSWHCAHHLAHITTLTKTRGW